MAGTVFGPYQLLEPLGRGGMGEVWRAYDSARLERFHREARAVSRLSDRHIIPIHPHGEIDGKLYMGMRLVQGRDLTAVLADGVAMARSGRAVSDRLRRAEASGVSAATRRPAAGCPGRPTSLVGAQCRTIRHGDKNVDSWRACQTSLHPNS